MEIRWIRSMIDYYKILETEEGQYYNYIVTRVIEQKRKYNAFLDRDIKVKLVLGEIDSNIKSLMDDVDTILVEIGEKTNEVFNMCVNDMSQENLTKMTEELEKLIPSLNNLIEFTEYIMQKLGDKKEDNDTQSKRL